MPLKPSRPKRKNYDQAEVLLRHNAQLFSEHVCDMLKTCQILTLFPILTLNLSKRH